MKESISYTFLLNIIILFVFVCAAIVMGVFSYYRAFKANSIVVNAIEKYEGFNCLSEQEAATKLNNISYNVPFNVTCKESYGKPCMTDLNGNYAVVSYNIDYSSGDYVKIAARSNYEENKRYYEMNSQFTASKNVLETIDGKQVDRTVPSEQTNRYQYGVYTYMYIDVPVIGSLIKIPFYSKTKYMYEYRKIEDAGTDGHYDARNIESTIYRKYNGVFRQMYMRMEIMDMYGKDMTGGQSKTDIEYNARTNAQYSPRTDHDPVDSLQAGFVDGGYPYKCGALRDYSKY